MIIFAVRDALWSYILPTGVLLIGVRLFLGLGTRPFRWLSASLASLTERATNKGISPFQTLTTVLSGTVGTGTIAGVATAIKIGGPGTLFYMWLVAFLGMLIKYCEALLAIKHRQVDSSGAYYGGVMYYINKVWLDFPKVACILSVTYAFACMLSALGIGASVQAHTIAHAFQSTFNVPHSITAAGLILCSFLVVFGGVKRIASFAEYVVPFMIVIYLSMCLWSLYFVSDQLPGLLWTVVTSALYGYDNTSLWVGTGIGVAIQQGVSRGIFTNEAGLGSSAFAHAASMTTEPLKQSAVSMLSTLIDTLFVCTLTGLVVLASDLSGDASGVSITINALSAHITYANYLISLCILMFGFTTMLTWCYYGEVAAGYIHPKLVNYFLLIWLTAIGYGCITESDIVWLYADLANACMLVPNLITLAAAVPMLYSWIYADEN